MKIQELPDRWIIESENRTEKKFLQEIFNSGPAVIVHIPRRLQSK